jgi:hypothetical protein
MSRDKEKLAGISMAVRDEMEFVEFSIRRTGSDVFWEMTMKGVESLVESMNRTSDVLVDRMTALSFHAFENEANGRLAGACMKIANSQRRYTEEVTAALAVIKEELDGRD